MIAKPENSIYLILVSIIIYSYYDGYTSLFWGVDFLIFFSFIRFIFLTAEGDMVLLFFQKFGKGLNSLNGKIIWITGASSGIGEALALKLAEANVKLVLSARSEDRLKSLKTKCIEIGKLNTEDILVLPFDMTNYDKHQWALKSVVEQFGKLDVLVSNAGRSQRANWEEIEKSVDEAMFDLNVFSLVALARLATINFIKNGGGHHVVMSSIAGKFGVPFSASYTGSKHALGGYFEALRTEKGSKGIAVTILCPGPVESNLMDSCLADRLGKKVNQTRTGRLMSGEKCAELSIVAIANTLSEAWICYQPTLLLLYFMQYNPTFVRWVMTKIDFSAVVMKVRDGKSDIAKSSDLK